MGKGESFSLMRNTLSNDLKDWAFLSHGPAVSGKTIITSDRVAVWWLAVDKVQENQWPGLADLLDDEERSRAERFHFEQDRHAFISAHALRRALLSYCYGRTPQAWCFNVTENGKPEVASDRSDFCPRINLSHTRGLVVVALTHKNDVGIDVESSGRQSMSLEIAEKVLSEEENRHLQSIPPVQRLEVFLNYWVLKEAYLKAIGRGMSLPMNGITFDLEWSKLKAGPSEYGEFKQWYFERRRVHEQYLLGLALRHPSPADVSVDMAPAPLEYVIGSRQ